MTVHSSKFVQLLSAVTMALVLGAPSPVAAQAPYSQIVLFGDSLSDTGNAFALLGTTSTPPDWGLNPFLIPNAPYARGGQNFSNGANWIELLARALKVPGSAAPAFRASNPGATNYATGAARARPDGVNFNLALQVNAFLQDANGSIPPDALYVFAIGTNDVRDALLAYLTGGEPAAQAVLQQALAAIVEQIATLRQLGAEHFLVWNVPDISLSPSLQIFANSNPAVLLAASTLTLQFNLALQAALVPLDVTILDVYGVVSAIVANPGVFGFSNVSAACLTPNVPPFTCRQPDAYLFWDGLHPTSAAHAWLAQAALDALGF